MIAEPRSGPRDARRQRIVVLAVAAPLSAAQRESVARRAGDGLARNG